MAHFPLIGARFNRWFSASRNIYIMPMRHDIYEVLSSQHDAQTVHMVTTDSVRFIGCTNSAFASCRALSIVKDGRIMSVLEKLRVLFVGVQMLRLRYFVSLPTSVVASVCAEVFGFDGLASSGTRCKCFLSW